MAFETTTTEVLQDVDLGGRIAVVTGATAGLGVETARALAAAGAHVVLTARDEAKGRAAAAHVSGTVEGASVEAGVLDLTSLASVRSFARVVPRATRRLHILINNAGVMATPFERTRDGFELQFGTNHSATFVDPAVEPRCWPGLRRGSSTCRPAVTSSSGIIWDDPNYERREYDKFESYGQSKTANMLVQPGARSAVARAWRARVSRCIPGMIATELGRYMTRDDYPR